MYNLAKKINDKWKTIGKIQTNKFGNLDCGIKITPEFLSLIEEAKSKGWLNLSVFEAKEESSPAVQDEPEPTKPFDDDMDVPF